MPAEITREQVLAAVNQTLDELGVGRDAGAPPPDTPADHGIDAATLRNWLTLLELAGPPVLRVVQLFFFVLAKQPMQQTFGGLPEGAKLDRLGQLFAECVERCKEQPGR